jgi:hypothetical protein
MSEKEKESNFGVVFPLKDPEIWMHSNLTTAS